MILPKDNTEVKIKEKINPVKREFPYKEFSFTQGNKEE